MTRSRRTVLLAGVLALGLPAVATAAPPEIELGVLLEPKSTPALESFATAVSTPGSPTFGQYLTPAQFVTRFAPEPHDVAAVRDALTAKNLTVSPLPANSLVLSVRGAQEDAEAAFGPGLDDPSPLGHHPASWIAGLWSRGQLPPGSTGFTTTETVVAAPTQPSPFTAPTPCAAVKQAREDHHHDAWLYDEVAEAYDFTAVRGKQGYGVGVTVGLVELNPYVIDDISAFQSCYGTAAQITDVEIDGGLTPGPAGETTLDVEVVAGLAPGADIRIYQAAHGRAATPDIYATIAAENLADVVSTSYGGCEDHHAIATRVMGIFLMQMAAQGQSFMSAAGDSGSEGCGGSTLGIQAPASQPWTLGVGGTSLSAIGDAPTTRPTEAVWNRGPHHGAGGGGISAVHPMPAWQTGPGVIGTTSSGSPCHAASGSYCRQVPDVSASADPDRGYLTLQTTTPGGSPVWRGDGGTSAASPLWAALTASMLSTTQCGDRRLGLLAPRLYPLAAAGTGFNDVTVGHNNRESANDGFYDATAGYDMASGLGSPVGGQLLAALCPVTPAPSPTWIDPLDLLVEPQPPRAVDVPAPAPPARPATPASAPQPAPVPVAQVAGGPVTATATGQVALGVQCPEGGPHCRVDVRVRGKGVDLRLRNRRVEAGSRRDLGLRLPEHARGRDRFPVRVTITTRTADGREATTTERVVIRGRGH